MRVVSTVICMWIDMERDYLGALYFGALLHECVSGAVAHYSSFSNDTFVNWTKEPVLPDYVFYWVETPAYLDKALWECGKG